MSETYKVELTEEEIGLIARWIEEKVPATSHCMRMRANRILMKLDMARNVDCPICRAKKVKP